jgi:RNA recognition motif-containing protein
MATKTLYVGNLPYGVTEDEVREVFGEFGASEVRLVADKGFAFVDVPDDKAADAISNVNGRDFKGRALRVDEARPRRERSEGGGGGGRGFGGGGGGGGGGFRRGGGGGGGGGERRGPRW